MANRYCLSMEQKLSARDLAISIYLSKGLCPQAGEPLYQNKMITNAILDYWKVCNTPETNYAINKLLAFLSVRHLQTCWKLQSNTHSQLENL